MLDFQTPQNVVSCGHQTYQSGEPGLEAYDLTTGNYSLLRYNDLAIVDGSGVNRSVINSSTLTVQAISAPNLVTISNDLTVANPEPYIELVNSVGESNKYNYGGLVASGASCYSFDNGNRFFKQNNPFSFKHWEIVDGDSIEAYMPFVMVQNASGIRLRRVSDYLDDLGEAGWSCVVSNYGNNTLTIDISDASSWYSYSAGTGQGNPITINKCATCRITLVYSSTDMQYVWAVSQF
jgi:hypothetical protein